MSTCQNALSQLPELTFWSVFSITNKREGLIELKIIEKTDETFKSTSSQIQSENNNSGGSTEELEKLKLTNPLQTPSFLKNEAPVKEELNTPDALNYTYDFGINTRQVIVNPCENMQNSNNSTKEASLLRRSQRIANRKLAKENSIEELSPKSCCLMPTKLPVGVARNASYRLSYNSAPEKQKV